MKLLKKISKILKMIPPIWTWAPYNSEYSEKFDKMLNRRMDEGVDSPKIRYCTYDGMVFKDFTVDLEYSYGSMRVKGARVGIRCSRYTMGRLNLFVKEYFRFQMHKRAEEIMKEFK